MPIVRLLRWCFKNKKSAANYQIDFVKCYVKNLPHSVAHLAPLTIRQFSALFWGCQQILMERKQRLGISENFFSSVLQRCRKLSCCLLNGIRYIWIKANIFRITSFVQRSLYPQQKSTIFMGVISQIKGCVPMHLVTNYNRNNKKNDKMFYCSANS